MNPIAFSPALLTDPGQFAVGRLPAVSDHDVYANEREACEGCSSLSRLLDGRWQFLMPKPLPGGQRALKSLITTVPDGAALPCQAISSCRGMGSRNM